MRLGRATAAIGAFSSGVLASGLAFAAEGDAPNSVSNAVQLQLFKWGVWTTGIARLDNAEMFLLSAMVVLLAFASGGINVILFKDNGLGFRLGWLLSIPVIVASMVGFATFRPYPTMGDAPAMILVAECACVAVFVLGWMIKSTVVRKVAEAEQAKLQPRDPALEKRIRMVSRPGAR